MSRPGLHLRRAGPIDAGPLSDLLRDVAGEHASRAELSARLAAADTLCHLAEDDDGRLLGLQWLVIRGDSAAIATFTAHGEAGRQAGSALFDTSLGAARRLGLRWIRARMEPGNGPAQNYYQSRGFDVSTNGQWLEMHYEL